MSDDRETKQQLFIRVCRDSGWRLDAIAAAKLTARVLGSHPMLIWAAMPSLDVMNEIAEGRHPACNRAATPHQHGAGNGGKGHE